jgi:hypothetical protein
VNAAYESTSDIDLRGYRVRISQWRTLAWQILDCRQVMMGAVYRRAMRKDASRHYDIQRRSILELAPPTMPPTAAALLRWQRMLEEEVGFIRG